MSSPSVGGSRGRAESVRRKIEESRLNAVREPLPGRAVIDACREEAGHEFRRRLLAPVVTVSHAFAAALRPEKSFRSARQALGRAEVECR